MKLIFSIATFILWGITPGFSSGIQANSPEKRESTPVFFPLEEEVFPVGERNTFYKVPAPVQPRSPVKYPIKKSTSLEQHPPHTRVIMPKIPESLLNDTRNSTPSSISPQRSSSLCGVFAMEDESEEFPTDEEPSELSSTTAQPSASPEDSDEDRAAQSSSSPNDSDEDSQDYGFPLSKSPFNEAMGSLSSPVRTDLHILREQAHQPIVIKSSPGKKQVRFLPGLEVDLHK